MEFISSPVGGRKTSAKVVSKKYEARRLRRMVNGALAALAVAGVAMLLMLVKSPAPDRTVVDVSSPATTPDSGRSVKTASASAPVRPVYRHSVVPGGVRSAEEIANVIKRDHVVAAHYKDINPQLMRKERLQKPLLAHVSYRLGDKVYWTKKPVPLPANEAVMTDGTTTIRERCGNLISMDPVAPASADEPSLPSFDLVMDPAELAWQPLGYPSSGVRSTDPGAAAAFISSSSSFPNFVTPFGPGFSRPGEDLTDPSSTKLVDPPAESFNPPTESFSPPTDPFDPQGETGTPIDAPLPVPEPGTLTLFGLGGAVGVAQYLRKRSRAKVKN